MLSEKFRPWHVPLFAVKYARLHLRRMPVLVHFEVTRRCNAHCDFCDYWKTPSEARREEVASFADAARYFDPLMVCFTGGEPLLRRDLEEIVAAVHGAVRFTYITLITHGAMLTPERALALWRAGVSQISVSLDFPDERHDAARGIPGLVGRIVDAIPRMRELGVANIRFNTVIKNENLDDIMPIVALAHRLGVGVGFSTYTHMKNGNGSHYVTPDRIGRLEALIEELLAFKRAHRRVITSSEWYLTRIPRYYRGELTDPCRSGLRTIHIDPTGGVRRCPDFPTDGHWSEFRRYQPIACNACFYACRGEAQAPLTLSRLRDVMA